MGKEKIMKKSIAKNYIYNLIYQMLTILLPLVTTPYLSRVLGAENIGIYGYTISIVTYFILFGTLGVSMYGQREIAYKQSDKAARSKAFWEIIILRTITLSISILLFYLIYGRTGEYAIYYRILIIQLVANLFDISWLFQGIEEFDKTVVRNLIVKLLSLVLIFVVIKTPEDLWKYFAIYVGAELLGNMTLWLYLPKYLEKINLEKIELKKHIKPIMALFVPQIAIQIYTVLDKTMIGKLTGNMVEVGYYEQAQKIVKAALTVIAALQTVMNSRIAYAYASKNEKEVKGSVRRKINSLPSIMNMFSTGTSVEEDFEKNRIRCSLAAGNVSAKLGFFVAGNAKPMTLLKGNELNLSKAKNLDFVLRRRSGETKFSEIIVGSCEQLLEHKSAVNELLSDELCMLISEDK